MNETPVTPATSRFSSLWGFLKWTLLIAAGVLLTGYLVLNFVLAPYIAHKLEKAVRTGSDGLYVLQMDNLKVHFWRGQVVAEGVMLLQDSVRRAYLLKRGEDVGRSTLSFKAAVITLGNIRWRQYLSDSLLRVGEVYIDFPELVLHRDVRLPRRIKPIEKRKNAADSVQAPLFDRLPELIGSLAKALYIDTLAINQGVLRHEMSNPEGTAYHGADSICIAFRDIRIDSSSQAEAWHRVLYASDVQFGLRNYQYKAADGIYGLKIKRVVSPDPLTLHIDSLDLRTLITDREFARRKKYSKDRFAIFIPRIRCHELDIERFFRNDYVANAIHLYDPVFNMYRDKHAPRDSSPRRMPNETVRELSFYFKVDTLEFHEAELKYAELVPGAEQAGGIFLEKTNLRLLNLNNDPEYMTASRPAVIQGETRLMGQGKLDLTLTIDLLSKQFDCQYSGSMQEMEIAYFNQFFLPNENLHVQAGRIDKVLFAIKVNNGVAKGQLKALYNGLKLGIIDPKNKKENKVLSLLSNLILKTDNTPEKDKPAKIGKVLYPRVEDDGFVRFLWRSLKTGLITTLVPEKIANVASQKKLGKTGKPPRKEEENKPKSEKEKRDQPDNKPS